MYYIYLVSYYIDMIVYIYIFARIRRFNPNSAVPCSVTNHTGLTMPTWS